MFRDSFLGDKTTSPNKEVITKKSTEQLLLRRMRKGLIREWTQVRLLGWPALSSFMDVVYRAVGVLLALSVSEPRKDFAEVLFL